LAILVEPDHSISVEVQPERCGVTTRRLGRGRGGHNGGDLPPTDAGCCVPFRRFVKLWFVARRTCPSVRVQIVAVCPPSWRTVNFLEASAHAPEGSREDQGGGDRERPSGSRSRADRSPAWAEGRMREVPNFLAALAQKPPKRQKATRNATTMRALEVETFFIAQQFPSIFGHQSKTAR
jgi:hypothetical protein